MEELLSLVPCAPQWNIGWDKIELAMASFVPDMSRTEQNPVYHGEGDVWTHTKLVCQALVEMDDFRRLSREKQQVVFLGALLHDIGKPRTTRWEDNRWTSPNHAPTGAKMARVFLWQQMGSCGEPTKQQLRETVCLLIRYHSFPPHALENSDGKRKMLAIADNGRLCPLFTMELLCLLSRADVAGRISADQTQMMEQVQLCAELARENGCYHGLFPFPSDYTRYAYLSGREVAPEVELYDDTWGPVILMSGLPGTGKDTWIRENYPNLPMISLDEIRKEMGISPTENQSPVAEKAREQARTLLRKKQPFIWNATNLSPMMRGRQLQLFADYHASTRIVYLETKWAEQLRRNANRPDAVPQQAICHMMEELVLPEAKEACRVDWYCV